MKHLISVLVTITVITGCAGFQPKNPADMSPKEVAVWANRQYEQQYTSYLQDYEYAKNNIYMREVLLKKKVLMMEIYPLLLTYNEYVRTGAVPPEKMTDAIIRLIYELTGVY